MVKKGKRVLWLIAFGILISACAANTSSNIGGGQALPQAPQAGGNYAFSNYVLINNRALLRDLQITDIQSRMANDLMQVQVQVVNKTSRNFSFDYSFNWFDSTGFQIVGLGDHWTPILINGNEVKTITGVAPTSDAQQFKVRIRKSR